MDNSHQPVNASTQEIRMVPLNDRSLPHRARPEPGVRCHFVRLTALALNSVLLASCSDTATQPVTTDVPRASAELAVASNSWVGRANMPSIERVGLATAVVPNASGQSILYAIGGRAITGGSLGKVQAYNVATNTWTNKASLPIAVYSTNGAGVIGGKIYISGGGDEGQVFPP
jgi:Kelch motif